jgi:hypothetical protein
MISMIEKSKLTLAACTHYVFTAFPFENLGARGFFLDKSLDHEENGVVTQSLIMKSPQGGLVRLEFREIIDEELFLAQLRQEKSPMRGRDVLRPGITFCGDRLIKQNVGEIPVQVMTSTSVNIPLLEAAAQHPNSANSLYGVYLGLGVKGIQEWSDFLGAPPEEGGWELADGCRILIAKPGDGLFEYMELRKDFPFWAVVIRSQSFSEFVNQADPARVIQWQGRPAALIKEHLTDWDLLVY